MEGFGAHSRIHGARILSLSEYLPVVIGVVDRAERIEAVIPKLDAMIGDGLVTLERVEVLTYRPEAPSDRPEPDAGGEWPRTAWYAKAPRAAPANGPAT